MYIQIESLFRSPRRQSLSSLYNNFTEEIILKRPFISETGNLLGDEAHHIDKVILLRR